MIGWLHGTLLQKQPPYLLVNVSGVGYEVEAPLSVFYDLPAVNETLSIYVHMVVREDAQLIFGFSSQRQRDLFRTLIKVNGVGPKVALAVLSTLSVQELMQCMINEDDALLTKVPGIGKKTAQRLIVELKDRLQKEFADVALDTSSAGLSSSADDRQDAISALVSLGYKHSDASRVVRGFDGDLSSEEIIRQALRHLSGRVL